MAKATKTGRREDAQQTFRQFAWNLAGTLARPAANKPPKPRTQKPAEAR